MVNLLDLPDEKLVEILECLHLDDIKNVRLTCKRLYYLSIDKKITKDECLLLNERVYKQNGPSIVSALMATNRYFNALVFRNDNSYAKFQAQDDLLAQLIAKFGENVKQVYFYETNVEFCSAFDSIVEYCPNLELMSIKECDDLFILQSFDFNNRQLPKMKSLKIYETKYLNDLILCRLFRLCPNLEEITFASCSMNLHNGVYKKYYRGEPSDALQPSNDVFNYKYLFYLMGQMKSITELNLSCSNLTCKSIGQILKLPNVKLRTLNFMCCREVKWSPLIATDVFMQHKSITNINLSHSIAVNDLVLKYICRTLVNLEVLCLTNCFTLTDQGFTYIENLKNLKELNINNDHEVTGNFLANLIKCKKITSLKALHVAITTDQITNYLTKMKLTCCEIGLILKLTEFDDEAIMEINKTQKYMKQLKIHSMSVTNIGFIGDEIDTTEPDLEKIFMNSFNTNLINYNLWENIETFRSIFKCQSVQSIYSISNLRNLESLNLDSCQQLTDQLFKYTLDLPFLRKLSLCSTKINFVGICYLVQKCPNLECLDLENTCINDAAVCILVQALPKLTSLSLKNCWKLTAQSYKFIAKHCYNLKTLHGWNALCYNHMCDIKSVLTEIFNLPNMSKLIATRCNLVQDENIELLPYSNPP